MIGASYIITGVFILCVLLYNHNRFIPAPAAMMSCAVVTQVFLIANVFLFSDLPLTSVVHPLINLVIIAVFSGSLHFIEKPTITTIQRGRRK